MHSGFKFIFIGAALVAGILASDVIFQPSQSELTSLAPSLDDHCMLTSAPCTQDNTVMTIDRDTVHPLVPVTLEVQWPESESDSLQLSLEGHEMDMGAPRFILKRTNGNLFSGEIILPVCTQESMIWTGKLTDGAHTVFPAIRMSHE